MTRRADEVKAAAEGGLGLSLRTRPGNTMQKIEEFRRAAATEGLLFVAQFPNAKSVGIAGDSTTGRPPAWLADREQPGHEAEDTFRALVALEKGAVSLPPRRRWLPGRRIRTTFLPDPNPFGEVDSVVEVV